MIEIVKTSKYRDGGTVEYTTKNGNKFYQDYSIGTKTRGEIYDKYPGDKDAKIITDENIRNTILNYKNSNRNT